MLQLYEALNQRMGVAVVGPSGCGKSILLRVLHMAVTRLGKQVSYHDYACGIMLTLHN